MIKTIRIYFAHPIRGQTGKSQEINYNCRMAKAQAAFMRSYLGPGYDIYCPADHDEMPQVAWKAGTFKTADILEADLVILRRCEIIVAAMWAPSTGVQGEVETAIAIGLSSATFSTFKELIHICDTLRETYG